MRYHLDNQAKKFLIGLDVRTTNENSRAMIDIPLLRERFFQEGVLQKIPHKLSDDIFVLYTDYESDHTKPYTVMFGCEVKNLDNIPKGLVGRTIPASNYAVFHAKGEFPKSVGQTWYTIWNTKLNRSYTSDFEHYPSDFDPQKKSDVKIYIAIS